LVTRDEYLLAIDSVDADMLDSLNKWMVNEKGNLDSFIANPQGHIMYSPYLKPNFEILTMRSQQLAQVSAGLQLMMSYKLGLGATRGQHDYALDLIPSIIWERLLKWLIERRTSMQNMASSQGAGLPLAEYAEFTTFDVDAFNAELTRYANGIAGLGVVVQFKKEQEELAKPPVEETPTTTDPMAPQAQTTDTTNGGWGGTIF
jgi:hypothetical protein